MAKFVCRAGPQAGYEYPFKKDRTTFGRQSSCDVQIMDGMASREHFAIRRDDRLFTLIDLESRNGTKVNGRKVSERQLEFDDRITVGEVEYVFVKEDGDVELRDLLTRKYEILEKIGEGGMGIVYKARQRSMDRMVALKVLAPKYASRPKFVQNFIDEARAAGRLNHPNIVQVHDVDSENNVHYFSMEFIDGMTCRDLLKQQGSFSQEEALEIGRLTAKALYYAHEHHIIHRDVKPDNIMIGTNHTVKLADLGISKTFEQAESEGKPKRVVGTPHYMAPEVALGHQIDHRIDIYALGATLYHLLANRTPFSGTTVNDVLKCHVKSKPPPLRDLNPAIHPEVNALIERMMAKEPNDRFGSCQDVIEAIHQLQERGILSHTATSGETLMLRRLAGGAVAASAESQNAPPTSGGDAPHSSHAASRSRSRPSAPSQDDGDGIVVARTVLTLVIIALALILAFFLYQEFTAARPDVEPEIARPHDQATDIIDDEEDDPHQPQVDPQLTARILNQRDELARIRADIDRTDDNFDASALGRRLDDILSRAATQDIRDQVETLRARLVAVAEEHRQTEELRQWRSKREEVRALLNDHEYEAAIEQIRAFIRGRSTNIQEQGTAFVSEIEEHREAFTNQTQRALQRALRMRDGQRLRQLRTALPLSMDDSPLAREIAAAIAELDAQLASERESLVEEVRKMVLNWDSAAVQNAHAEHHADMADTTAGEELASLHRLSQLQTALITAINEHVGDMERKPRFTGLFYAYQEPDLLGAEASGLILRPMDGSRAIAPWNRITPELLTRVLEHGLPEEQRGRFAALVQFLTLHAP